MSTPASNLLDFILESNVLRYIYLIEIENLPDDLQDLFLMITYKDTHFEGKPLQQNV